MIDAIEYGRCVPGMGQLTIAPFDIGRHAGSAHRWLTSEHARFWGMTANSAADTVDYFAAIASARTHTALIGRHAGQPAFLVEVYDPAAEPVGRHYAVAPGDAGLHILIAPPRQPIHLFTWAVFALTVDALLDQPGIERLVVEPDVGNTGIHALNKRAGFVYHRRLKFEDKKAWLATCTARDRNAAMTQLTPAQRKVCAPQETPA